jgi:GMP synthase (glutamine-hydrolysing)
MEAAFQATKRGGNVGVLRDAVFARPGRSDVRLAVLQHEPATGLGRFADLLESRSVDYEILESTHARRRDPSAFDGILSLGGSLAASDPLLGPALGWIRDAVLRDVPYLGVCLGGQLLARALGARVGPGGAEAGVERVFLTDAAQHDSLFSELPRSLEVFAWHGETFDVPRGAVPLAGSMACACQAFRFRDAAYALQFHPEVRSVDLIPWAGLPSNRQLLEQHGRTWDDVLDELDQATTSLDDLAAGLLGRWLSLVGVTEPRTALPMSA